MDTHDEEWIMEHSSAKIGSNPEDPIEPTKAMGKGKQGGPRIPYVDGSSHQTRRMYVPVAVDDLLQEKVQSGELPLKYLDQYRFIISHIVFERMTDKRYEEEGSYVRMNMDTLRRHISQDYAYRFRDALIAWKIIECNGVYSKREHTSF